MSAWCHYGGKRNAENQQQNREQKHKTSWIGLTPLYANNDVDDAISRYYHATISTTIPTAMFTFYHYAHKKETALIDGKLKEKVNYFGAT